jgi:hypothetical protein
MPRETGVGELQREAHAMYVGTCHGRPIANGYSSFFPGRYHALRHATRDFPDARSHEALRARHIDFVIARAARQKGEPSPKRFRKRFEREGLVIYEILR